MLRAFCFDKKKSICNFWSPSKTSVKPVPVLLREFFSRSANDRGIDFALYSFTELTSMTLENTNREYALKIIDMFIKSRLLIFHKDSLKDSVKYNKHYD